MKKKFTSSAAPVSDWFNASVPDARETTMGDNRGARRPVLGRQKHARLSISDSG